MSQFVVRPNKTWVLVGTLCLAVAGVAASPVYELLGKRGLINPDGKMPKPDVAYLDGDLGYRVHTGGHTPAPDWPAFVEFTAKYFKR